MLIPCGKVGKRMYSESFYDIVMLKVPLILLAA
jgi:hypothetical protein